MLGNLASVGLKIIDKVIPDAKAREEAKLKWMEAQNTGELKLIEAQLSAIVAEAQSSDKWTSRARPTFLYVVYIFILSAIPMGILYSFQPESAQQISAGVKMWLESLPSEIYYLFGVGYLGYTGARSYDKKQKSKTNLAALLGK